MGLKVRLTCRGSKGGFAVFLTLIYASQVGRTQLKELAVECNQNSLVPIGKSNSTRCRLAQTRIPPARLALYWDTALGIRRSPADVDRFNSNDCLVAKDQTGRD